MIFAAGVGAALMYVFDPDRGNARRALARDRSMHALRGACRVTGNSITDVLNHTRGLMAEYRARMVAEQPSDVVLGERVRSEIGHVVRHAHRISVTSERGWIRLSGDVLPAEKDHVIDTVSRVPGVFGIEYGALRDRGWIASQLESAAPAH